MDDTTDLSNQYNRLVVIVQCSRNTLTGVFAMCTYYLSVS